MSHVLDPTLALGNAQGSGGPAPDPDGRPPTRVEQLGHGVTDRMFRLRHA